MWLGLIRMTSVRSFPAYLIQMHDLQHSTLQHRRVSTLSDIYLQRLVQGTVEKCAAD